MLPINPALHAMRAVPIRRERRSVLITTTMRTGAELRRLTEAEKERVDGHAVDAEEHARDYVRRDYDDLQPYTP